MPKTAPSKSVKPQSPPPSAPPNGRVYRVREAFPAMTGYEPQTFYNAVCSGKGALASLPYFRVGRSIRIAGSDLDAFLQARRVDLGNGK
jgi:hypothetical protein